MLSVSVICTFMTGMPIYYHSVSIVPLTSEKEEERLYRREAVEEAVLLKRKYLSEISCAVRTRRLKQRNKSPLFLLREAAFYVALYCLWEKDEESLFGLSLWWREMTLWRRKRKYSEIRERKSLYFLLSSFSAAGPIFWRSSYILSCPTEIMRRRAGRKWGIGWKLGCPAMAGVKRERRKETTMPSCMKATCTVATLSSVKKTYVKKPLLCEEKREAIHEREERRTFLCRRRRERPSTYLCNPLSGWEKPLEEMKRGPAITWKESLSAWLSLSLKRTTRNTSQREEAKYLQWPYTSLSGDREGI